LSFPTKIDSYSLPSPGKLEELKLGKKKSSFMERLFGVKVDDKKFAQLIDMGYTDT
jgi:hypothetical protein